MTDESLAAFLRSINATSDVVQQGFRLYVAEVSDDLPPARMEEAVVDEARDAMRLRQEMSQLQESSQHLEAVALYFLSEAWEDPEQRESVKDALREANVQLPIIEVAMLSVVAMYGMYLIATRGRSSSKRITVRGADGSFEEKEEIQYASPMPWVKGLVSLFGAPPP